MNQSKKVIMAEEVMSNSRMQTVVVAIPGLGDLPGTARTLVASGEQALDVELLLPGGDCTLCCELLPRHLDVMGATVRVLAAEQWMQAVFPTSPIDSLAASKIDTIEEAKEERDAALSECALLRDYVKSLQDVDSCKNQLRHTKERVRILRAELESRGFSL